MKLSLGLYQSGLSAIEGRPQLACVRCSHSAPVSQAPRGSEASRSKDGLGGAVIRGVALSVRRRARRRHSQAVFREPRRCIAVGTGRLSDSSSPSHPRLSAFGCIVPMRCRAPSKRYSAHGSGRRCRLLTSSNQTTLVWRRPVIGRPATQLHCRELSESYSCARENAGSGKGLGPSGALWLTRGETRNREHACFLGVPRYCHR